MWYGRCFLEGGTVAVWSKLLANCARHELMVDVHFCERDSVTAKVWVGSQTISPNQWSSRVENVKLGIEIVQVSSE